MTDRTTNWDENLTEALERAAETDPILQFFKFGHLPPKLQNCSRKFAELASDVATNLPRTAERTVALRKLLEAKDAAVRTLVGVKE